jgi:hypothetical protein
MAEVPAPVTYKCSGCPRHYDGPEDLAPARIGTDEVQLCRRCYTTALGISPAIPFEKAQELR